MNHCPELLNVDLVTFMGCVELGHAPNTIYYRHVLMGFLCVTLCNIAYAIKLGICGALSIVLRGFSVFTFYAPKNK